MELWKQKLITKLQRENAELKKSNTHLQRLLKSANDLLRREERDQARSRMSGFRNNPCGYLDVGIDVSVKESIRVGDRVVNKLVLPGIRGQHEQLQMLKDALKARGFEEAEGKKLTRKTGEILQIADLDELTITSIVEIEETKERKSQVRTQKGGEESAKKSEEMRLQKQLEKDLELTKKELEKKASELLEKTSKGRVEEIKEVIREVYLESLKKRASDMGPINNVEKSKQQGEIIIRISGEIDLD